MKRAPGFSANQGLPAEDGGSREGAGAGRVIEVTESRPDAKEEKENRVSFLRRLKGLPEDTIKVIDFAYDLGKEAHRTQKRDTGERYFEHLREVALILIDECGLKDPDLISICLLHDSGEDSPIFGNATEAYSKWKETAHFRLSRVFNPEVAEGVILLTKPKVDGREIGTKEEAHRMYLAGLSSAKLKLVLVKMADRLHNLRTLSGTTPEKQRRITKETREVYLPLFQGVLSEYPTEGQHLLDEMEKAMTDLEVE